MIIKTALLISIVLQFLAAFLAIRFIKVTRGKISWILISLGLLIMAIKRLFEVFPYLKLGVYEELFIINDWLSVLTSLMITIGVIFIGEIFFSLRKAELERERAKQKVLTAILRTEETERKRFASDLHDGLAPILTTIKLYSDLIKKGDNKKISQEKAIQNIDELVSKAISTTREISNNITSNTFNDFGLLTAVNEFCNYINETKSVRIIINSKQYEDRKPGLEEAILFQVIKELINNTIKHAQAQNIIIDLKSKDKSVLLTYHDDGIGFDVPQIMQEKQGMGLSNIINKVESIKGSVELISQPSQGMTADITIELDQ